MEEPFGSFAGGVSTALGIKIDHSYFENQEDVSQHQTLIGLMGNLLNRRDLRSDATLSQEKDLFVVRFNENLALALRSYVCRDSNRQYAIINFLGRNGYRKLKFRKQYPPADTLCVELNLAEFEGALSDILAADTL